MTFSIFLSPGRTRARTHIHKHTFMILAFCVYYSFKHFCMYMYITLKNCGYVYIPPPRIMSCYTFVVSIIRFFSVSE